jgi:hypothetical protein
MKNSLCLIALLCAVTGFVGCSRKPDPKRELEKAAVLLDKSDATPALALPASTASPAPESPSPAAAPVVAAPGQQLRGAIAAYKAGNLEDAVTRLQKLRATPVMSPEQRIALNDAMAAVMSEIYSMAAKGDSRAIQAVQQYELLQTQRR